MLFGGGSLRKVICASRHVFLTAWLMGALAGCGATADRPAGRSISEASLDAWGGPRSAAGAERATSGEPPGEAAVAAAAEPIELAGGDRLRAFVALVRFEGGASPVCAVYVLRATAGGLQEGRRSIACPTAGLSSVAAEDVRHRPIEEPRLAQLQSALDGARPVAGAASGQLGPVEHIAVRVVTDRGTVEGAAAPAAWPSPIEDQPEPSYARAPANLTELYEAVMYPHRYERSE